MRSAPSASKQSWPRNASVFANLDLRIKRIRLSALALGQSEKAMTFCLLKTTA